ncbi:hypothetical protein AK830_g5579 [Neonectria ditissima]|uniref:NAD(P)-binding protein n=1 Tax=Neonectria ditissima TaxID=78410 RepID=A0A0N8H769_9HYPO|nr:hypothetical protein AK830_g5579 [Neonectria ditissima]
MVVGYKVSEAYSSKLNQRTVFITGANSGVGLALTNLFLERGWNVAATIRDTSSPTPQNLASESGMLLVQYLDLSKPTSFQPALDKTIERFGKIDVLINNAGHAQVGLLEHLDVDSIRRNFEVNVFGTMGLIKASLPHLRATTDPNSPSRIIYIGSGAGHFAVPLFGPYNASKAAMNLFMESLVYEMEGADPPIEVKLVLAGMDQMTPDLQGRYGAFVGRTMQILGGLQGQSMTAACAAETVWTAATDDQPGKLRYFVGPRDGGMNLQRRMRGGQPGEDLDEVDKRYMDDMKVAYM